MPSRQRGLTTGRRTKPPAEVLTSKDKGVQRIMSQIKPEPQRQAKYDRAQIAWFLHLDEVEKRCNKQEMLRLADHFRAEYTGRKTLQSDFKCNMEPIASSFRRNRDVLKVLNGLERAISRALESVEAGDRYFDIDYEIRRVDFLDGKLSRLLLPETTLGLKATVGRVKGTETTKANGRQKRTEVQRLAHEMSNKYLKLDKCSS